MIGPRGVLFLALAPTPDRPPAGVKELMVTKSVMSKVLFSSHMPWSWRHPWRPGPIVGLVKVPSHFDGETSFKVVRKNDQGSPPRKRPPSHSVSTLRGMRIEKDVAKNLPAAQLAEKITRAATIGLLVASSLFTVHEIHDHGPIGGIENIGKGFGQTTEHIGEAAIHASETFHTALDQLIG